MDTCPGCGGKNIGDHYVCDEIATEDLHHEALHVWQMYRDDDPQFGWGLELFLRSVLGTEEKLDDLLDRESDESI